MRGPPSIVFWLGKKYQTRLFIADIYRDPDHYLELAKKVKEAKVEKQQINNKFQ